MYQLCDCWDAGSICCSFSRSDSVLPGRICVLGWAVVVISKRIPSGYERVNHYWMSFAEL